MENMTLLPQVIRVKVCQNLVAYILFLPQKCKNLPLASHIKCKSWKLHTRPKATNVRIHSMLMVQPQHFSEILLARETGRFEMDRGKAKKLSDKKAF